MRANAQAAVNWMMNQSKANATTLKSGGDTFPIKGYCLKACRMSWDLPGDEASAIKEWYSIDKEHKRTDPLMAPPGVPHFFQVGTYGHVVIQSNKQDYVWSTDAPYDNKIGLVHGSWFRKNWRHSTYLGWSYQFQNHDLRPRLLKSTGPSDDNGDGFRRAETPTA